MKGIILAGGSSDRLWPLSRKNFPKQFMDIREHRSLLQETVARNIPFCEEFLVIANRQHRYILEGQMRAFQGLRYRMVLEESGKKTGPAIALAAMCLNPGERVLVTPSDLLMEGGNYKEAVIRAKALADEGSLVLFTVPALLPHPAYGYVRTEGERVADFVEKPSGETAERLLCQGTYQWNTGMYLFRIIDFLHELEVCCPDLYHQCKLARKEILRENRAIFFPGKAMGQIAPVSMEHALVERSGQFKGVALDGQWSDIDELEALIPYMRPEDRTDVILHECRDVSVINRTKDKLVVVNQLENVLVTSTPDAVYVSKKDSSYSIKHILSENKEDYRKYYESGRMNYRFWGCYELLSEAGQYRVCKVRIYPGQSTTLRKHLRRSKAWSVVEGTLTVTTVRGGIREEREYGPSASVSVEAGVAHKLSNLTGQNLVLIETEVGEFGEEQDLVFISREKNVVRDIGCMVKLEPAFKDYIWGGTRLREQFGKACDYDVIAESWELSAHEAGQSVIAQGRFQGMPFGSYLQLLEPGKLGWKCQAVDRFPILIKFIDALSPLSVQVHPDDEYGLSVENEYGKNEMWYIVDCVEGANLYCGFNRPVTKEEVRRRVKDDTLSEVLKKISVHKGDSLFVEAGTVHAIGAGILICEIQQNSNCTYRLYDYGRRDKYGNLRPLHLERALDVVNFHAVPEVVLAGESAVACEGYEKQLLSRCKYFESTKYTVLTRLALRGNSASFQSVVFLSGSGRIRAGGEESRFRKGDSFFITAGEIPIVIEGACECIVTHV